MRYIYLQFASWTKNEIWFVTRMKDNAVYEVTKVIEHIATKDGTGVLKEEEITLSYKNEHKIIQKLPLRRITFKDEKGRIYYFLTNKFKMDAQEVALIYKYRWKIELLFKQIKQNFPLRYFWGESENAIRIQIYCVLIAQLLMIVIKKKSQTKKSFASIITVVRLHLMSYVELFAFIKDTYKEWRSNGPPMINIQPQSFDLSFDF